MEHSQGSINLKYVNIRTSKSYICTYSISSKEGINLRENLKDKTIEDDHFKLEIINGIWTITNLALSAYKVYIKILPNKQTQIKYGRSINIGDTWIRTSSKEPTKFYSLENTFIYEFEPNFNTIYTISRADDIPQVDGNCIFIPDVRISTDHLKLLFSQEGVFVTDGKEGKFSTNGTYIDCLTQNILQDGQHIRISKDVYAVVTITPSNVIMVEAHLAPMPYQFTSSGIRSPSMYNLSK